MADPVSPAPARKKRLGARGWIWTTFGILQVRQADDGSKLDWSDETNAQIFFVGFFSFSTFPSLSTLTLVHQKKQQTKNKKQAFALVYILLAIVTTKNIDWLRKQPREPGVGPDIPPGRVFNAVLAALVLSMLVLVANFVWSLLVLLKSTASGHKLAGFAHGSTLSSTFHIAALLILVGCVLNAFAGGVSSIEEKKSADGAIDGVKGWGRPDTDAYNATFVLAFILAGLHVVLWAMLLTCRSAFVKASAAGASA